MTTQEIYKLASEITEQQVENVVSGWIARDEKGSINEFNSLVRLGDSKKLACATVMVNKVDKKEISNIYTSAYEC